MANQPSVPGSTEGSDHVEAPGRAAAPARIGPYAILGVLGEGGMGTVYLAEQRQPMQRRVALKVIKLGMDSKAVLARFDAERQALSMMEHSCIARIHDAGVTESGQPYFAMEYVKGIPITRYCDANRLSLQDRIELFRKVCSGVQHAHLKGVMHRDLKPSNILVTLQDGQPMPKIIDFGLAKAVDHRLVQATIFTELGQVIGTPEYMSPEQAGLDTLDVDSRTDIYSLGVLLYELLTGSLPFTRHDLQRAGLVEMQRVIRETDPPKPSTRITTLGDQAIEHARQRGLDRIALQKRLRGDLDWIVLKAIEKDRARRYETALELAADLERHLQDLPVLASPPGLGYRARKFAKRYRGQLIAAGLLLLSLGVGLAATTWFWLDAREQARRAEQEATTARAQEQLAGQRAAEAEARRQEAVRERTAKEAALVTSEAALRRESGQRLVAQGLLRIAEDPGLAVALALEGSDRSPGPEAESGLRSALAATRERSTVQIWDAGDGDVSCAATADLAHVAAVPSPRSGELILWSTPQRRTAVATPAETPAPAGELEHARVELSADGRLCVVTSSGSVRVHRTDTGAVVANEPGLLDVATRRPAVPVVAAFSGTRLLVGTPHGTLSSVAVTGDVTDRAILISGNEPIGPLRCATHAPRVLVRVGEHWEVHDVASRSRLATIDAPRRTAPQSETNGDLTPDGSRAVMWDGFSGTVVVWDAERGRCEARDPSQRFLTPSASHAIDAAGRRLALGCYLGVLKVYDLEALSLEQSLEGLGGDATAVAFDADGSTLAVGLENGTIVVLDAATWDQRLTLRRHAGPVRHLAFATKDELISLGGDGVRRHWILADPVGRRMPTPAELHALLDVFSPIDGAVFDRVKGRLASHVAKRPGDVFHEMRFIQGTADPVFQIRWMRWGGAFSPDGRHVATSWLDGLSWRTELLAARSLETVRDLSLLMPAFGPDGKRLVGRILGKGLAVVPVEADAPRIELEDSDAFTAQAFSADSRQVIGVERSSSHGSAPLPNARIWDAATGRAVATLHTAGEPLLAAALSADARRAAGGGIDGSVVVWDVATGQCAAMAGHAGIVHAVCFGPGGDLVASGGSDGTVRLWDVAGGREVGQLGGDGSPVLAVAFSKDAKWICYGTVAGLVAAEPVDPVAFAKERGLRTLTPAERARFSVGSEAERAAADAAWRSGQGLDERR
jgi:serine/threonine protein kinase/WD40 repeat protein